MRCRLAPCMLAVLFVISVARGEELQPGEVLSQQNWQLAKDLLPPEMLRHYERGEYANLVMRWENGQQRWSRQFLESTQRNAGALALDAHGSIVDKTSGERPDYICGFPFPNVTAEDPQAGLKILWNHYFYWWNNGNLRNYVELHWVAPKGVERTATQDVYFLYYQGQPRQFVPPKNPDDLLVQLLANTVKPADLNGTTALSWRFRDPDKRDSAWAYVPALRRVRAVSPTNRSDGFLGSDMSQDDGPFFDGKPEDFEWKLVGEVDTLRLVDPLSLDGKSIEKWLPQGGWRSIWPPDIKVFGQQDPNWKGLAWAPIGPQLAKRPMWIIEAVPKDKYYLYGKIQLYIDRETYQGAYNRKFSWSGELLNAYAVLGFISQKRMRPDGGEEWLWGSNMGYQTAENIKMNRATVSGQPAPGKDPANDRRIRYDPSFFDFNTLQRFGK